MYIIPQISVNSSLISYICKFFIIFDLAIERWQWSRDPDSLAVGDIVGNMTSSRLLLTNLVPGTYSFSLQVRRINDLFVVTSYFVHKICKLEVKSVLTSQCCWSN